MNADTCLMTKRMTNNKQGNRAFIKKKKRLYGFCLALSNILQQTRDKLEEEIFERNIEEEKSFTGGKSR